MSTRLPVILNLGGGGSVATNPGLSDLHVEDVLLKLLESLAEVSGNSVHLTLKLLNVEVEVLEPIADDGNRRSEVIDSLIEDDLVGFDNLNTGEVTFGLGDVAAEDLALLLNMTDGRDDPADLAHERHRLRLHSLNDLDADIDLAELGGGVGSLAANDYGLGAGKATGGALCGALLEGDASIGLNATLGLDQDIAGERTVLAGGGSGGWGARSWGDCGTS